MMKCFLNYQLGNSRNKLFLKKEIGPEQMEQMINYLLYTYLLYCPSYQGFPATWNLEKGHSKTSYTRSDRSSESPPLVT